MPTKSGTVSVVRKDRKGFQIDGEWFSGFNIIPGVEKGSEVSFEYYTNKGFNNIRGSVKVDGSSSPTTGPTTAPAKSSGGSSYSRGSFPIERGDGQRSIIRQNALTNSRELYTAMCSGLGDSKEDAVTWILSVAAAFEEYSTGEVDGVLTEASDEFPEELLGD